MAIDPEELLPRPKKPEITLGEDLSALSVRELEARIGMLEAEIIRHKEALASRATTRGAAESIFKR